jgi:hypothetical protein
MNANNHQKPRKAPVQRAYTGLVGRYCDDAPKPIQAPAPVPAFLSTEELLEKLEISRAEKQAERARGRRRLRREQLANIKKALKTPIAEIKQQARLAKQIALDHRSVEIGHTGGFGSKKMEEIAAAIGRAELLGPPVDSESYDPETYAVNDRRHVEPEGTSFDGQTTRFTVKSGTPLESGQALQDLFRDLFVPDSDDFRCRLCGAVCLSERRCQEHLEKAHGDDQEPEHDQRFGNIIDDKIAENRKRQRQLRKAA